MNTQFKWIVLFSSLFLGHQLGLQAQGIILNEASNGNTGSREFFEFVVVGADPTTSCGTVDLRGWIFDDNNGDFSGGASSGEGIATGHARFGNVPAWSAIPIGSVILLFNPLDKNVEISITDDPYDANNDFVYCIPLNNADLEFCTQSPSVPSSSNGSYTCSSYLGFNSSNSTRRWDAIQMRNGGDAAQIREPNGTYFHGISYGSGGGLGTGGPDGIHIGTTNGGGNTFMLNNAVDVDWTNSGNFSRATVASGAETPGTFNSAANQAWVESIRCNTLLPVEIVHFSADSKEGFVQLEWTTSSESQNREFRIERSGRDGQFTEIGVLNGAGTTNEPQAYHFEDYAAGNGTWYYRLRQIDYNGASSYSKVAGITGRSLKGNAFVSQVYPNPAYDQVTFQLAETEEQSTLEIQLFDLNGKLVASHSAGYGRTNFKVELDVTELETGLYLYRVLDRRAMKMHTGKLNIR